MVSFAASHGVRFVDVTRITATRPDAALGGQGRGKTLPSRGDCLHYCLPGGPIDTIAELIYNAILAIWPPPSPSPMPTPTPAEAEEGASGSADGGGGDAFFHLPLEHWLHARRAGVHLESACNKSTHAPLTPPPPRRGGRAASGRRRRAQGRAPRPAATEPALQWRTAPRCGSGASPRALDITAAHVWQGEAKLSR